MLCFVILAFFRVVSLCHRVFSYWCSHFGGVPGGAGVFACEFSFLGLLVTEVST